MFPIEYCHLGCQLYYKHLIIIDFVRSKILFELFEALKNFSLMLLMQREM